MLVACISLYLKNNTRLHFYRTFDNEIYVLKELPLSKVCKTLQWCRRPLCKLLSLEREKERVCVCECCLSPCI